MTRLLLLIIAISGVGCVARAPYDTSPTPPATINRSGYLSSAGLVEIDGRCFIRIGTRTNKVKSQPTDASICADAAVYQDIEAQRAPLPPPPQPPRPAPDGPASTGPTPPRPAPDGPASTGPTPPRPAPAPSTPAK